jgi:hypothetical protein
VGALKGIPANSDTLIRSINDRVELYWIVSPSHTGGGSMVARGKGHPRLLLTLAVPATVARPRPPAQEVRAGTPSRIRVYLVAATWRGPDPSGPGSLVESGVCQVLASRSQ